jgi:hypothetical protein
VDPLFALVGSGLERGRISDHAARDIRHGVDEALHKLDEGKTDDAIEELEKLRDKVAEFVDEEEIANSEKQKLDRAIEMIEEQIRATAGD